MSPDELLEFERRFVLLPILAFSMVSGLLLGGFVICFAAASRRAPPAGPANEALRTAFYAAAAAGALGGAVLKARLLSDEGLRPAAQAGCARLMAAVQVRFIVLLGLFEFVGFLGLISFILSGRPADALPFGVVSLAGFAGLWPRRVDWQERVGRLLQR